MAMIEERRGHEVLVHRQRERSRGAEVSELAQQCTDFPMAGPASPEFHGDHGGEHLVLPQDDVVVATKASLSSCSAARAAKPGPISRASSVHCTVWVSMVASGVVGLPLHDAPKPARGRHGHVTGKREEGRGLASPFPLPSSRRARLPAVRPRRSSRPRSCTAPRAQRWHPAPPTPAGAPRRRPRS